jgi:hypothetical protein
MPKGTSWRVESTDPGTSGYRIRLALARGDVRWNRRCEEWLDKNFDTTRYTKREVVRLMAEQAAMPKAIRGQHSPKGFQQEYVYSVVVQMNDQLQFIEFVIEPDEDDNPGLVIVSAHRQLS